jgi:hypothetical protein
MKKFLFAVVALFALSVSAQACNPAQFVGACGYGYQAQAYSYSYAVPVQQVQFVVAHPVAVQKVIQTQVIQKTYVPVQTQVIQKTVVTKTVRTVH